MSPTRRREPAFFALRNTSDMRDTNAAGETAASARRATPPHACVVRATLTTLVAMTLATLAAPRPAAAGDARAYEVPLRDGEPATIPPIPAAYGLHRNGGILIAYNPSTYARVRPLFERVDALRAELSAKLGRVVLDKIEIRVAASPEEMARLVPGEPPPRHTVAVSFRDSFHGARLLVMSAASPIDADPPDLEAALRRELSRIALDEAVGSRSIPRWFEEGFALHASGEDAALRTETLCRASLTRRLLTLGELDEHFPPRAPSGGVPEGASQAASPASRATGDRVAGDGAVSPKAAIARAEAADFARFLLDAPNHERFVDVLARVRGGEPFGSAIAATTSADRPGRADGAGPPRMEQAFRNDLARRYGFLPVLVGALLVWVAIAAAVVVRRLLRRRALAAAAQKDAADAAEVERRLVRTAGVRGRAAGSRVEARRPSRHGLADTNGNTTEHETDTDTEDGPLLPEIEVPKIEHDGRWHTLH